LTIDEKGSLPARPKKGCRTAATLFMDLAGIEPASESLSLEASPITATPFKFPHPAGERRPSGFSSFIIRLQTQSFACIVSRNNDAGYRTYGCDRADGCDYAATANSLSAFNFKNPVLSWSGPRMASSTSKPPSKPVQALVNKSLNSSAIKPQNSGQVNKPQVYFSELITQADYADPTPRTFANRAALRQITPWQ